MQSDPRQRLQPLAPVELQQWQSASPSLGDTQKSVSTSARYWGPTCTPPHGSWPVCSLWVVVVPRCADYSDVCLSCHCRQQMFQPPPALDDGQSLLALLAQGRSSTTPALSPAQAGALKALTHSPAASQAAGLRKANKSVAAKPSNMSAHCPPSQHTMSGQGAQAVGPWEFLILDFLFM